MNKKIIVFGLISLFLMTGLTTASAIKIPFSTKGLETNNNSCILEIRLAHECGESLNGLVVVLDSNCEAQDVEQVGNGEYQAVVDPGTYKIIVSNVQYGENEFKDWEKTVTVVPNEDNQPTTVDFIYPHCKIRFNNGFFVKMQKSISLFKIFQKIQSYLIY